MDRWCLQSRMHRKSKTSFTLYVLMLAYVLNKFSLTALLFFNLFRGGPRETKNSRSGKRNAQWTHTRQISPQQQAFLLLLLPLVLSLFPFVALFLLSKKIRQSPCRPMLCTVIVSCFFSCVEIGPKQRDHGRTHLVLPLSADWRFYVISYEIFCTAECDMCLHDLIGSNCVF